MIYKEDEVTLVKKIKSEDDKVDNEETQVERIKPEDDKVDKRFKETVYKYLDSMEIEGRVKLHPSLRMNSFDRLICKQLIAKHFGNDFEDNVLLIGDFLVQPDKKLSAKLKSLWKVVTPSSESGWKK